MRYFTFSLKFPVSGVYFKFTVHLIGTSYASCVCTYRRPVADDCGSRFLENKKVHLNFEALVSCK